MDDDRPAPLPGSLIRSRLVLGIVLVVVGIGLVPAAFLLAASVMDGSSSGQGGKVAGLPAAAAFILLWFGIRQLHGLSAVARGERWWAFVEVRKVQRQIVNGNLVGNRRSPATYCYVELRSTTDEKVIGYVQTTCEQAERIARDGVVGVYGRQHWGARVVLGGSFGVIWQISTIMWTTS